MNTLLLGIDPGQSGSIAILYPDGTYDAHKMPETPKDACDIIASAQHFAVSEGYQIKAFMEEVGGYIGSAQPGSAAFVFGRGYGNLEGFLIALGISFELVKPQKWQKPFSLGTVGTVRGDYADMTAEQAKAEKKRIGALNGKAKAAWKGRLKEVAQRLYPQLQVTLKTADALLILEYARRQENIAAVLQPAAVPSVQTQNLI